MKRQGFTLVETVLALALLGVLTLTTVSWTTTMLRFRSSTLRVQRTERDIQTFERLLAIDLVNHDLQSLSLARREQRIWVQDGALHVLTRDGGLAEVVYALESGRLTRHLRAMAEDRRSEPVVISDAIDTFGVSIDIDEREEWGDLVVELRPADSELTSIVVPVSAEWVR